MRQWCRQAGFAVHTASLWVKLVVAHCLTTTSFPATGPHSLPQALVTAGASLARLSPEELRQVVRLMGRACKVGAAAAA